MRTWLTSHGIAARLGVHTGEASRGPVGLMGEAVTTAACVAGQAAAGEVRVTQVVRDLVHGSPLQFGSARPVQLDGGRFLTTLAAATPEIGER